ncbi:MAG: hypothetical protein OXH31_05155 [Gammaproteobacteria bacterium]|nr:hypothetical protein [Gammaproteobacteria bacterium]
MRSNRETITFRNRLRDFVVLKQLKNILIFSALITSMMSVQHVASHQDLLSLVTRELLYGHAYMNTFEKEKFQEKRYQEVLSELKLTALTPADQELLAQAFSKLYVGVPLSNYTYADVVKGEFSNKNEWVGNWEIVPDGAHKLQVERPDGFRPSKPLYSATSPFIYFPAVPFSLMDGTTSKQSETMTTFTFPLDRQLFAEAPSLIRWVTELTDWMIEFTVDKQKQTPLAIKIRLAEPVRKRGRYSFDRVDVNMSFTYIESCEVHARTSLSIKINGRVFSVGKVEEEITDTYSNIVCDRPLVYLHPHSPQSGHTAHFLGHISLRYN